MRHRHRPNKRRIFTRTVTAEQQNDLHHNLATMALLGSPARPPPTTPPLCRWHMPAQQLSSVVPPCHRAALYLEDHLLQVFV
jgi:hypothetical protein